MPKYALRTATALALVAALSIIAVSLLTTGARNATASNTDASAPAAPAITIPAQYTEQCSNGTAVPNPASNAGLVSDCAALLASKDTLEGTTGNLNWSADSSIDSWDGVGISPNDIVTANNHVSGLWLYYQSLNGEIPAELGNLTGLSGLRLDNNQLTGEIPAELGNLTNLSGLRLDDNQLTGEIPSELGNLANIDHLYLQNNQLTGEIPSELGNIANLDYMYLYDNRLTGEIPPELGNLAKLRFLFLNNNQLTGEIPAELGNLANLVFLRLEGNQLTGCIPQSLRGRMDASEIQRIGLPFCAATTPATPTPTATSTPRATATPTPAIVIEPTFTPTGTPAIVIESTPTPTSTSAPRATPTPTSTPAATSTSSSEVMNKLDALGRQVADNPDLSRQVAEISDLVSAMSDLIATMAARIAELEGGNTGAATATPTPTATPAIVIEPTPTPTATATATPSPTPTRVAAVERTPAACVQNLGDNFTGSWNSGSWAPGCLSANPPNNDDYYARFYTFTLRSAAQATITLSSDDASPYLYLLNGAGTGGSINRESGSATASSATITLPLQPGAYTIEATTWHSETPGDFTLELEITR